MSDDETITIELPNSGLEVDVEPMDAGDAIELLIESSARQTANENFDRELAGKLSLEDIKSIFATATSESHVPIKSNSSVNPSERIRIEPDPFTGQNRFKCPICGSRCLFDPEVECTTCNSKLELQVSITENGQPPSGRR